MVYSALLFWLLAFIFPIGLYPFQDFTRDFLTVCAALLLFSNLFWQRNSTISFTPFLVFLLLGLCGLLGSYLATDPSTSISYNSYLVAFLTCAWVSLSATELKSAHDQNFVVDRLASFLLLASMLCGLVGLLRYYGVLRHVIPVVTEDGNRLLGSFGQPNLTAVLMTIGLSALLFLKSKRNVLGDASFYSALLFLIYCGTLTGSRTWFVVVGSVLLLWALFHFKPKPDNSLTQKRFRQPLLTSVCLFLIAIWAAPTFDNLISEPLIDSGYVNRVSAETMYKNREMAGSSGRFAEWQKVLEADFSSSKFWLGYGAGRYGVFSNEVALKQHLQGNGAIWNNAHNIFINFFIEFGMLGLFFIIACYLYIARLVLNSIKSEPNIFLISIIGILMLHSLVEFSLWSLPFLTIFIAAISLLDKSRPFTLSGFRIKRTIVIFLLIVFLPFGIYVGRDAITVINVMYKQTPDSNDRIALQDVRRSSIIGGKATSVLVLKFQPPISSLKNALAQINKLSDWRPEPLFLLRKSTLLAATGQRDEACLSIEHTIKVYPITLEPIQKELNYFSERIGIDSNTYYECIFKGVGNWVN
jgi:O-antigen ligase